MPFFSQARHTPLIFIIFRKMLRTFIRTDASCFNGLTTPAVQLFFKKRGRGHEKINNTTSRRLSFFSLSMPKEHLAVGGVRCRFMGRCYWLFDLQSQQGLLAHLKENTEFYMVCSAHAASMHFALLTAPQSRGILALFRAAEQSRFNHGSESYRCVLIMTKSFNQNPRYTR